MQIQVKKYFVHCHGCVEIYPQPKAMQGGPSGYVGEVYLHLFAQIAVTWQVHFMATSITYVCINCQ